MKKLSHPPVEKFTDLPVILTANILNRLPLRDAARTSVLSRSWRNKWSFIPVLEFDDAFVRSLQGNRPLPPPLNYLIDIIHQILLQRGDQNQPIEKLVLSLPGLASYPHFDNLVHHISGSSIWDLSISFANNNNHSLSRIFSCVTLRQLKLTRCLLEPPHLFQQFNCLSVLTLMDVGGFNGETFEAFLSNCPTLEKLSLMYCQNIEDLVIHNPMLKFLKFKGIYKSISFRCNLNLVSVAICLPFHEFVWDISNVKLPKNREITGAFSSLAGIQNFTMGRQFFLDVVPNVGFRDPPYWLMHMKKLDLQCVSLSDRMELTYVLHLMSNAHNLQILKMFLSTGFLTPYGSMMQVFESNEFSNVYFNRLEEVYLEDIFSFKAEFEFIKFLLARSPRLRWFELEHHETPSYCAAEQVTFLKRVIRFPRISPFAQVKYNG